LLGDQTKQTNKTTNKFGLGRYKRRVKRRPSSFFWPYHRVWHEEEKPAINSWNGRATIFILYLFIFIIKVSEMPRLASKGADACMRKVTPPSVVIFIYILGLMLDSKESVSHSCFS
jgi:hypothetical protein